MSAARWFMSNVALSLLCALIGALALSASALAVTPPVVEEESVLNVAGTSATLQAKINPESNETTYRFEYGTSEAYGSQIPVPDGVVGSGPVATVVSAHLQNLLAGTTYHYRVVALVASSGETVPGGDGTFTTQPAGGELALLDGRQWELVSPAAKLGATILPEPVRAADSGDAITYVADAPTEADPPGDPLGAQVFSMRVAGKWESHDIQLPQIEPVGSKTGIGYEYRFFSSDLSLGIVEPFAQNVSLSPKATEPTPYIHENVGDAFVPLVTSANVPPGTKIRGGAFTGNVRFVGATQDLSHVVVSAQAALTGAPVSDGLYEWTAGRLQLVTVQPESEGGEPTRGTFEAISEDGSRVFWTTSLSSGEEPLYMRDTAKGETIRLDLAQGGSGAGGHTQRFQFASSDGSRVFFTAEQHLLADSSPEEPDLYECEMVEAAGKLTCNLSDLTASENAGENGSWQATLGIGEDGSYIYFVAKGVLAPGAQSAAPGYHLYVRHNGTTTYIGNLSPSDDAGEWQTHAFFGITYTARVSPSGRYVAFISKASLTGYDNRDASSGEADEEVYLYDAETKRLLCASCNPTGARPVGSASIAQRSQRFLSDSGRLFFESPEALVGQDTNGQVDVYEYEPEGLGGCVAANAASRAALDGCVDLVSSGTSEQPSTFMDASESGDDVFFLTSEPLASQDFDSAADVYDAHVCSAALPCTAAVVTPPACTTADSCRAAPAPQPAVFGAPATATFAGSGNPVSVEVKPKSSHKRKAKPKRRARKRKRRKRGGSVVKKSVSARTKRQGV